MRGGGFLEGPGFFSSARRPARFGTPRRAGRRSGCRTGMDGRCLPHKRLSWPRTDRSWPFCARGYQTSAESPLSRSR